MSYKVISYLNLIYEICKADVVPAARITIKESVTAYQFSASPATGLVCESSAQGDTTKISLAVTPEIKIAFLVSEVVN
jgi:hypothetical protein